MGGKLVLTPKFYRYEYAGLFLNAVKVGLKTEAEEEEPF
jgi:hypothetical protein